MASSGAPGLLKTGLRIVLGLLITGLSLKTVWHVERGNVVGGRGQAQLEHLAAIRVAPEYRNPAAEGELVLLTGELLAANLHDPLTGFRVSGVALQRQLEMLQWSESCRELENRRKQCQYQPRWLDVLERSDRFDRQFSEQGLANPGSFPGESVTLWGEGRLLGAYQLSESYRELLERGPFFFERWETVDPQQAGYAGSWYQRQDPAVAEGDFALYRQPPPLAGEQLGEHIGALRVRYRLLPALEVTVAGRQEGELIVPHEHNQYTWIQAMIPGSHDLTVLLQGSGAFAAPDVWGNRQGAWPMLLIGFGLLLPPLIRRTAMGPGYADLQLRFRFATMVAATLVTALVIRVVAMV
tara:strand:+ start:711 stop:1772 length:1062 start_codon:yes stop_codon:yes gene_type:complete